MERPGVSVYFLFQFDDALICSCLCSGGRKGALATRTDQEWERVKENLRGFPKLSAVTLIFDITESTLLPYQRKSAPLGHAILRGQAEPMHSNLGTQVRSLVFLLNRY